MCTQVSLLPCLFLPCPHWYYISGLTTTRCNQVSVQWVPYPKKLERMVCWLDLVDSKSQVFISLFCDWLLGMSQSLCRFLPAVTYTWTSTRTCWNHEYAFFFLLYSSLIPSRKWSLLWIGACNWASLDSQVIITNLMSENQSLHLSFLISFPPSVFVRCGIMNWKQDKVIWTPTFT